MVRVVLAITEQFTRKFGESRKHLEAAGVPKPQVRDFPAARFKKDKTAIATSFMDAIRSFEAYVYDPDVDFEGVVIRALDIADAARALRDETFNPEWWVTVPCDAARRPLARWHDGDWNATDRTAVEAAQHERRRTERARIEAELAALRRQRLAAL
jgi:hypothetical protein